MVLILVVRQVKESCLETHQSVLYVNEKGLLRLGPFIHSNGITNKQSGSVYGTGRRVIETSHEAKVTLNRRSCVPLTRRGQVASLITKVKTIDSLLSAWT